MREQTENKAIDLVELLSLCREIRVKLTPFLVEEANRSMWQQIKDILILRTQDIKLFKLWRATIDIETWAIRYRYEKIS